VADGLESRKSPRDRDPPADKMEPDAIDDDWGRTGLLSEVIQAARTSRRSLPGQVRHGAPMNLGAIVCRCAVG